MTSKATNDLSHPSHSSHGLPAWPDHRKAQCYRTTLKNRLKSEGSQVVTNCDQLKMPAADGKNYSTDAAIAETLLRLVQSVPRSLSQNSHFNFGRIR